jgi:tetratricopeptide (TPR) repeat protein
MSGSGSIRWLALAAAVFPLAAEPAELRVAGVGRPEVAAGLPQPPDTSSGALARVRQALGGQKADAGALCLIGEGSVRELRFKDAEVAFNRALAVDPRSARAHLGLGRIAVLLSKREEAKRYFSRAYQLDPLDPEVILAFANSVEDRRSKTILWGNFLALAKGFDPAVVADVRARLSIEQQLGDRDLSRVASPNSEYRIPLFSYRPYNKEIRGVTLAASLDGGKPLRLMIDTGASGVTLNPSAVRAAGLNYLALSSIGGFGGAKLAGARIALAKRLTIAAEPVPQSTLGRAGLLRVSTGPGAGRAVEMENVLVQVADQELIPNADGIIGTEVFQDFLIRLDLRGRVLQLSPLQQEQDLPDMKRAYRVDHLLLLRATVNGHSEGFFMLDTGSAYSVVSRELVPALGRKEVVYGAQGQQEITLPTAPLRLRLDDRDVTEFEYAALDTREVSEHHHAEIAGSLGYSLLRDYTITVDYRNGLVGLTR